ncbi:MAG: hypothetical protein AAF702_10915 [Chloroflexota bacterium]
MNIFKRNHIFIIMTLLVSLLLSACQFQLLATENSGPSHAVPQAVRDMAGTYVGSWTMFGLDGEGNVVKYSAWKDTVTAENPQLDGDRAYVHAADEMVFENSNIPPMTVTWEEGYFLMPDGTLGDQFIESFGQTTRMIQLSDNVWTYATSAHAEELASLGFLSVSSGQHVTTKVVTTEAGIETHRVTRVTTVNWTDHAGQDQAIQFVSLQGVHQRQSE